MRHVRQQVLALELVRQLETMNHRIFNLETISDIAKEMGLKDKDLASLVKILLLEGRIAPVRRGSYAITPTNSIQTIHSFEIAMELVSPAAISHWSALAHHKLVVSPSPFIYILTHTSPSIPRYRRKGSALPSGVYPVGDLLYHFVQVKPARFFGIEKVLQNSSSFQVTDLERTLCDAVTMPQYCGGWTTVEAAFYAARDHINVNRIIYYALKCDIVIAKRIGWLLEYQGKTVDQLIPLIELPIKGFRLLDASGKSEGPHNSRWMVRVNTISCLCNG